MKRFMILLLCLLPCLWPLDVYADSQSTELYYSVPATVIYQEYDGTSVTQKVEVGTILKAPEPKGKPGCVFEGWKNEKTGLLWDFTQPVEEHLTLTASYSEFQEAADGSVSSDTSASGNGTGSTAGRATAVTSTKTGDTAHTEVYIILGLLAVAGIWTVIKRNESKKVK